MHTQNKLSLPWSALWPSRIEASCTKSTSIPVSSRVSRTAAAQRSSPWLTSPVGSFQNAVPVLLWRSAAGPDASWITPTPTECDAFAGSGDSPPGSHLFTMRYDGSAWWKPKPRPSTAAMSSGRVAGI